MTNPVFVVSSVEKAPTGHLNWPINLSHCTSLTKDYFFATEPTSYLIWFYGCVGDRNEPQCWVYASQKERDAEFDRILKAFPGAAEEPEPVSDAMVLENVINWLEDNATACVVQELRKAMLTERGEKK